MWRNAWRARFGLQWVMGQPRAIFKLFFSCNVCVLNELQWTSLCGCERGGRINWDGLAWIPFLSAVHWITGRTHTVTDFQLNPSHLAVMTGISCSNTVSVPMIRVSLYLRVHAVIVMLLLLLLLGRLQGRLMVIRIDVVAGDDANLLTVLERSSCAVLLGVFQAVKMWESNVKRFSAKVLQAKVTLTRDIEAHTMCSNSCSNSLARTGCIRP